MTNEIIALMSNQAKYILQCGWQSQEIRRKRLVRAKKIIRVMSRHVLGQILHGKLGKKKLSLIQGWPKSNYLSSWVGPEETVVRPESVKWKVESVFLRELGIVYIVNIVSTLCQHCVNIVSTLRQYWRQCQKKSKFKILKTMKLVSIELTYQLQGHRTQDQYQIYCWLWWSWWS